jgi:CRP-like cAMP-binding protein
MTVEPLGALSVEEVALVTQNCEERAFGKGQALCRQGAAPDSFHVIVDGEVEVSGPEHGQAVLGPGRTLGLLTMLSRLEAGLEATARSDARTLEMSAEVLSEVMEDRISILFSLIRRITRETLVLRRKVPDGARLGGAQRFPELESAPRIDLVARLRVLRRGSLFRRAGVGTLVQMATAIEERRAPAGTVLWRAGDPTGFFYLVIGGTVACRRPGGATFFAEAGYPLGNLESQAGEPRWYTAVAETPVILLRGSTEKFRDVLEDNPDVAMDFLGQVALGRINVAREPLSTR